MPELPEVETMRRSIAGAAGGVLERLVWLDCPRKPIVAKPGEAALRRRVEGRRIESVGRLGKRVTLAFDSGDTLAIEPRMTGLVTPGAVTEHQGPNPLYLRLRFDVTGGALDRFWFWDQRGLGQVRLYSAQQLAAELGPDKLGPDGLAVTADEYRERLGRSRRPVKVALLDQKGVAGVGNIYASELLHVAGVHPAARCDRLTAKQWSRITDATHAVLEEAVRLEGSSLGDGTYRNALNQDGGYQNLHRVYDRAGKPCPRCGRDVQRIVQAQRSTYFCPGCQTRR
ncbi:MAG: Fpg/Nei family DNA glycosylase [Lacipirellulaceae bacterium]